MNSVIRTTLLLGAAALFTACGNAGTETASTPAATAASGDRTSYERPDDHAIGRVDAPLVVVEYASVTCPGCAQWHSSIYPDFKAEYIDTGKVRYVFREFLTGAPDLAEAGFKIALCADEENYFKNIKLQFDRFQQIMQMYQQGNARTAYINLAKASGLSEEEFAACMANEGHRETIMSKMQQGFDEGVTGTPAFFVNGESVRLTNVDVMREILNDALGEDAPAAPAPDAEADAEEPAE